MERRSFLAGLLSLPILAGFRPVKEKELMNVKPNISPDDTPCSCSGISTNTYRIIGIIPEDDGSQTLVYRNEESKVFGIKKLKTEIY